MILKKNLKLAAFVSLVTFRLNFFFFLHILLFLHTDVNYWLSCRLFQAVHIDGELREVEDED